MSYKVGNKYCKQTYLNTLDIKKLSESQRIIEKDEGAKPSESDVLRRGLSLLHLNIKKKIS